MNELYYIDKVNTYFETLYYEGEASVTETQNFINNYLNFILIHNGINPKDLNIKIHYFNKAPLGSDHIFGNKPKKPKKLKQPNKENIKKPRYEKTKKFLAYVECNPETKEYNVYLNKNNMHVKGKQDCDNLMLFMFTIGHEFDHVVQHEKNPRLVETELNQTIKFLSKYRSECISHENDNNYITKLKTKISHHNENYLMTTACEMLADKNSIVHFNNFVALTCEYYTLSKSYYIFLNTILNTLQDIYKDRKFFYHIYNQNEKNVKKSLIENFNFEEDDLIIP